MKWLDGGSLKNLPSQFDFSTNSKKFSIFTDDPLAAGVFTIVAVLTEVLDDDPLPPGTKRIYPDDVKFTVTITFIPPADDNTAPYFKPVLSNVIVGLGATYVYSCPEVVDD